MKHVGKAVGAIVATVYLAAIIYLELKRPLDWQSLLILLLFLIVWAIIVIGSFASFIEGFHFKFAGVEIWRDKPNKKDKTLANTQTTSKYQQKLSNKFMQINIALHSSSLSAIGLTYESPELLDEFVEQVNKAKKNNYDLTNDKNYQEALKYLINDVLSSLGISMQLRLETDHKNIANFNIKDNISSTFNNGKVNFDALKAIQKQVEKADSDPNIPVSFSKAISDLKKLQ